MGKAKFHINYLVGWTVIEPTVLTVMYVTQSLQKVFSHLVLYSWLTELQMHETILPHRIRI